MNATRLPSGPHRRVQSRIDADGTVEVSLVEAVVPPPADDEVVVRVEAAPINPSDLGALFGSADLATLADGVSRDRPVLRAQVAPVAMAALALRVGQPLPAGNEGAGTVVDAGKGAAAQALLGTTVACLAGGMYADLRLVKAADCLRLPEGVGAEAGAAAFVNPLTALGFVETVRREGHVAMVHTAAASNLGQMLQRLCAKDGCGLVNVVRSEAQAALLRQLGARHVVDSSRDDCFDRLTDAIEATGATLAFDAVGGGPLAGLVLSAMERALLRKASGFDRYGSPAHKQVYVYGGLQGGAIELRQDMGKAWSVSGWLVTPFLARLPAAQLEALRARVAAEITTTFASRYSERISLAQLLDVAVARRYARKATGEKFLVCPALDPRPR